MSVKDLAETHRLHRAEEMPVYLPPGTSGQSQLSEPRPGVIGPCFTVRMSIADGKVRLLVEACTKLLGDPAAWKSPTGYPDSLALCIIDSIQSVQVKYPTVVSVLNRYRHHRREQGAHPERDGATELVLTFSELGSADAWAASIGTGNRVWSRLNAPLKAAVIEQAALAFAEKGVLSTAELVDRAQDPNGLAEVEQLWTHLPGQSSGITWHYLLMLAGVPGVKPDRMIRRFVAQALAEKESRFAGAELIALVTAAAEELMVDVTTLDHSIWQYQRRQ